MSTVNLDIPPGVTLIAWDPDEGLLTARIDATGERILADGATYPRALDALRRAVGAKLVPQPPPTV